MHGALKWGKRILSLWFMFVAWVHLLQKVFLKGIRRLLTQNIWIQFYNNTAHRIFNSYEMHQMYLIFIFLSAFVCLYFNVPLFHPLRTHKWSWIKFGNCLTLPVDSIPIRCSVRQSRINLKLSCWCVKHSILLGFWHWLLITLEWRYYYLTGSQ